MIGYQSVEAHNSGDCGSLCPICDFYDMQEVEPPTYGMCLACRSIEVALVKVIGTRDFSSIGEHPEYPVGYGCEVCA